MVPGISVIIPTNFRSEKYLQRAIDSLIAQKLHGEIGEVEVVISNNSPKSVSFLEAMYAKKISIKIVNAPEIQGPSYARNKGAEAATHDLLAFLDDDDWLDENYLKMMLEGLTVSGADMCICGFSAHLGNDTYVDGKLMNNDTPVEDFYMYNPGFTGSNFLIRRDFFQSMGGWDENLYSSNDKDFFIRFIKNKGKFNVIPYRLSRREAADQSGVTQVSQRKIDSTLKFIEKYQADMSPKAYQFNKFKYDLYNMFYQGDSLTLGTAKLFLKYPRFGRELAVYVKRAVRSPHGRFGRV